MDILFQFASQQKEGGVNFHSDMEAQSIIPVQMLDTTDTGVQSQMKRMVLTKNGATVPLRVHGVS